MMDSRSLHDEIVKRILTVFPYTTKVVLFGSRALGTHTRHSDFDLLIVTPTVLSPAHRGAKIRTALLGLGVSFDIVAVTPDEFERLRTWKSTVVYRALQEGESLHEAA